MATRPWSATAGVVVARVAGALYVSASIGFLGVFSWLASYFGYPEVLDQSAHQVLPSLLALGSQGQAVWAVYALLPLVLIPASLLATHAVRFVPRGDPHTTAGGVAGLMNATAQLQIVAATCMTIGLARWSTAQSALAEAWVIADARQRDVLAAVFDSFNRLFGNAIGEFVGELALYSSFAVLAFALKRAGWPKLAMFGAITAISGLIGMFRNVSDIVQPASDASNLLLPLFLILYGASLWSASSKRAGQNTFGTLE